MNDTQCPIQIPGFTHHGDCNLICKPTEWKDIILFFLGNYGAHAATVIGKPGQSTLSWALSILLAICFPGAGVLTGVQAISSRACFAPTELTKAARAGALCMIFRADDITATADEESKTAISVSNTDSTTDLHAPRPPEEAIMRTGNRLEMNRVADDNTPGIFLPNKSHSSGPRRCICRGGICVTCTELAGKEGIRVSETAVKEGLGNQEDEKFPPYISTTHVNGLSRLPRGYRLLVLPGWVTFENDVPEYQGEGFKNWLEFTFVVPFRPRNKTMGTISSSYNILKILVSIGQLVYAAITLYETRGNQISVYGYAAFGLTVAPYIWMSMVNLIGNLICPQYPTMFLVNSSALDELRNKVKQHGMEDRYPLDSTVGRISKETEEKVIYSYGTVLRGDNALSMALEMFYNTRDGDRVTGILRVYIAYAIAAAPIAIVGAISLFKPGNSAPHQRVWTMLWLCLGPMVGTGLGTISMAFVESRPVLWRSVGVRREECHRSDDYKSTDDQGDADTRPPWWERDNSGAFKVMTALFILFTAAYMAPAIGGFVVVGQMLNEYGSCVKTD